MTRAVWPAVLSASTDHALQAWRREVSTKCAQATRSGVAAPPSPGGQEMKRIVTPAAAAESASIHRGFFGSQEVMLLNTEKVEPPDQPQLQHIGSKVEAGVRARCRLRPPDAPRILPLDAAVRTALHRSFAL